MCQTTITVLLIQRFFLSRGKQVNTSAGKFRNSPKNGSMKMCTIQAIYKLSSWCRGIHMLQYSNYRLNQNFICKFSVHTSRLPILLYKFLGWNHWIVQTPIDRCRPREICLQFNSIGNTLIIESE